MMEMESIDTAMDDVAAPVEPTAKASGGSDEISQTNTQVF